MDPGLSIREEADGGAPLELRLEREIPGLRAFLRRLVGRSGGGADADDLLQEVMERALRYRHAFDLRRALGPWLRRAAYRAFLDQRERERRAPRVAADWEHEPAAAARADVEEREHLELLLARLAPPERAALERFHRDGQSIEEIARALELPAGTVKSHLHRGRRKLARLALEQEERA